MLVATDTDENAETIASDADDAVDRSDNTELDRCAAPEDASLRAVPTVCNVVLPSVTGPSWNAGSGGGGSAAIGNDPTGHAHRQ